MTIAQETAELLATLPQDKAQSVLEFARFLAEKAAEEQWEETASRAANSPAFAKLLSDVDKQIAKQQDTPLHPGQL